MHEDIESLVESPSVSDGGDINGININPEERLDIWTVRLSQGGKWLFVQLVVQQQYRKTIMKLAHESIMCGHFVVKRTIQKVMSEFFWPGISSDIKRYCRSCDICQRTISKGKNARAPLSRMPIIDTPLQRVAIDLVVPLEPCTYSKNKYSHDPISSNV